MKTFLVAVDSSPVAQKVVIEAVALARAVEARIVLFRAISLPRELPHALLVAAPDRVEELLCEQARRELEEVAATVPRELLRRVRVKVGQPAQAINEAAHEEQAALIVIGSHGHRAVDRLLGTTAARVVDHAERAVLVIRADPALAT